MKKTAIALMLLLLPSPRAFAQATGTLSTDSQAVDEVRESSRMHVGPFYLVPRLLLKQFGVDSNVFYQTVNEKSDFTFTVAPTLTTYMPVAHRALFTVSGAADLVYFAKYSTERSIDPEFLGRGEVYLNHLTLYAEDSFLSSRERPNFEIDLRSRRKDNLADAGFVWRFTPKTGVDANVRSRSLRYDADAFFDGNSLNQTLNHDSTGFMVTPQYYLTHLTTLGVRVVQMQELFPLAPERNNDTLRVMPGVEFKARALVSGSAYVGHLTLTPKNEALLPAYSGLVANLALAYTLQQSTNFRVTYDRDLDYALELFQPYFVSDALGLTIRRELSGKFDVEGSGQRYRYTFSTLVGAPAASLDRIDRIRVYSGTLGYRIGNGGRLGIGAWYVQRDSTVQLHTFNSLRFGTTMTYGF